MAALLSYKQLAHLFQTNGWAWIDRWVSGERLWVLLVVAMFVLHRLEEVLARGTGTDCDEPHKAEIGGFCRLKRPVQIRFDRKSGDGTMCDVTHSATAPGHARWRHHAHGGQT